MTKIEFSGDITTCYWVIKANGQEIGYISGGRTECYVGVGQGQSRRPVARFKRYLRKETSPTLAKAWAKKVFSKLTPDEVVQALGSANPVELAEICEGL